VLSNGQAIALLYLCTVVIFYVAFARSRTESQNLALFKTTGELKCPRMMVIALFLFPSFVAFMAPLLRGTTWPLALGGPVFGLFALFSTFFGFRFTETSIYYGWRFQHVVAYKQIEKLERIAGNKTIVYTIRLKSGEERQLGSNISCEDTFIEELHRRSGCAVYYRGPGNQFTKKA
jgi:hypothetical protein